MLAVAVAVVYPIAHEWLREHRTRRAHLEAVAIDVLMTERQASVYRKSKIRLPAYRVPLHGLRTAMPALLAGGKLSKMQAAALVQFYVDARSFNFCLDLAQDMKLRGLDWQKEISRIEIKAGHLVPKTKGSRFDKAVAALKQAGLSDEALRAIPVEIRIEDDDEAPA